MQIKYDNAQAHYYPLVPNRISDCLQGNIYDVRDALDTTKGVHFEKTDFAWFSPASNLLAVRTSPTNMKLIHSMFRAVSYDPPMNMIFDAKVSISRPADTTIGPEESMSFRISTHSGQRCTASATSPTEPGYTWEFEPVLEPNGKTVECNMVLKITYKGHEYATTTAFTVVCGKTHSMLIGTTPDKQEIIFYLTAASDWLYPACPLDDPKNKEPLKRIKKELAR